MTSLAPILQARDIERTYSMGGGWFASNQRLRALRGVSLELNRGETLGIVGESGCGKSTLAKILLGLEKPDAGDVLVDGESLGTIDRLRLARRVQPVFQDPYSTLNPKRKVSATVELPLIVHGFNDVADRHARVKRILDRVGLPARSADAYPNQLSGGQRQRVAIARALILEPEIVICDEPTSALDVSIQAQILNLMRDLQNDLGISYIFISHNLAVVENLASRVAIMYLGRVVEEGPAETIFRTPRHPYTRALLDSVLTIDPEQGLPDIDLGISFPDPLKPPQGCTFHPRCPARDQLCSVKTPVRRLVGGRHVECHFADTVMPHAVE